MAKVGDNYVFYDHIQDMVVMKKNDDSQLVNITKHEGLGFIGRSLRGVDNSRVMIKKYWDSLLLLNVNTKTSEPITNNPGSDIRDFYVLPNNQYIYLTRDRWLVVEDYSTKQTVFRERIGGDDFGHTLAVCSMNRHIAVHTRKSNGELSRVMAYENDDGQLTKLGEVDVSDHKELAFMAMNFISDGNGNMLLVAMTYEANAQMFVFKLNNLSGKFEELVDWRQQTEATKPSRLFRIGNELHGVDFSGRMFKVILV